MVDMFKCVVKLKEKYLKQCFFPNLLSIFINPFFFARKRLLKCLFDFAPCLSGKLLDFGCGSKPYKSLFVNVTEYIGVDVENEGHNHDTEDVDFYYDGVTLPFADESFESILCSEVLEHVPDIDITLNELNRVLLPGGKMLITVPFVWTEHELPHDYRRFTLGGLCYLVEKSGFDILKAKTNGAFLDVIMQMWMMFLHNGLYTKNKYFNILLNVIFISPFCMFGIFFSYFLPKVNGLYLNVAVIVKKRKSL